MPYEILRRVPRYFLVAAIELTDLISGTQVNAQANMLSLFGCGVKSGELFPQGASVRVRLLHQGAEISALARVVYSRRDLGMGLAFTSIEPQDQQILELWSAELARFHAS